MCGNEKLLFDFQRLHPPTETNSLRMMIYKTDGNAIMIDAFLVLLYIEKWAISQDLHLAQLEAQQSRSGREVLHLVHDLKTPLTAIEGLDNGDPDNFMSLLSVDDPSLNIALYKNPAFNNLIAKGLTTPAGAERDAVFTQLEKIASADAVWLPILAWYFVKLICLVGIFMVELVKYQVIGGAL